MQYNNTTDKNGLLQDCEAWCGLGDGGISGDAYLKARFTAGLNKHEHKVVTMILESRDDVDYDDPNQTNQSTFTFPLVAGQRDYNLALSEKILKIKRIDVCYSGTGNTCYRAEKMDSGQLSVGLGNDTALDSNFSKTNPKYDLENNGYTIKLYPMANAADVTASGLIRVECVREIDEFTTSDTTQEPGFDEPFHPMVSMGASYDWLCINRPDAKTTIAHLEKELQSYEARLRRHYGRKNEDSTMRLGAAYINYN